MPKIISRADAKRTGRKMYFTGKPCPQGHLSEKYTRGKQCLECGRMRSRRYYANNLERFRTNRRIYKRGVDQATYDQMVKECGDQCSVCRSGLAKGRGSWHVDHCHSTGKIRGLLCHHCNTALGLARDSIPILQSMIEYLKRWASVPPPKEEVKP